MSIIWLFQADFMNLDQGFAYVSFGVVLFVWEFLPTFLVVIFFRVQRPKTEGMVRIHLKNFTSLFHSDRDAWLNQWKHMTETFFFFKKEKKRFVIGNYPMFLRFTSLKVQNYLFKYNKFSRWKGVFFLTWTSAAFHFYVSASAWNCARQ